MRILIFFLLFINCAIVVLVRLNLNSLNQTQFIDTNQYREVLYLPKKELIRAVSFGYHNIAADILWFHAINYFGKHFRSDHRFPWLYHFCDTIITSDPRMRYVYEFGSMMLAWEQNSPAQAIELISKAIYHFQNDWKLYYYRGFFYMYFLKDNSKAREDFIQASKLPGVHPLVASLAAKKLSEIENPKNVMYMLKNLIRETRDASARQALIKKFHELKSKNGGTE
jgi:tetratricopeptide (TPR) repeat protein